MNFFKSLFYKQSPPNYDSLERIQLLLTKLLNIYKLSINNDKLSIHESNELLYKNHLIDITISFVVIQEYHILPFAKITHIIHCSPEFKESIGFHRSDQELTQLYTISDINTPFKKYFNSIPKPLLTKTINYLDSMYIKYI